eukprot:jgi/Mesen1/7634/ME000004S07906
MYTLARASQKTSILIGSLDNCQSDSSLCKNVLMTALTENLIIHFRELDRIRKDQDSVVRKINKIHSKLCQTAPEKAEKLNEKLWTKLRGFYIEARKLAEAEENTSNICVKDLDGASLSSHQRKRPDSFDFKRKRVKTDHPDAAAGASAARAVCTTTQQLSRVPLDHSNIIVAARVTPDDEGKDEWIVVKVTRFDRETNRYDVVDEEPGDGEEEEAPTQNASAQDFPLGSQVLAVYPGTTALYRATVVGTPRKRISDDYFLEFDDDEEDGVDGLPQRQVPFHHVVQLPEGHRQ